MNQAPPQPAEIDVACPECDYNLRGATGDRCPWCGWSIDLAELLDDSIDPMSWQRVGVTVTGFVFGCASLLAIVLMSGRRRNLSIWDGLAVLSVLIAAAGHLGIAALALLRGRHWPLRHREAGSILLFAGFFSVLCGTAGAARFLFVQDRPQMIRGVTVTNAFEFGLALAFFTLPAWALLALRLVSFRDRTHSVKSKAKQGRLIADVGVRQASFKIEFARSYRQEQVTQSWCDAPRPTDAAIERAIDQTWEAELALAQASQRRLYDGKLARLVRAEAGPNELHLELGPTSYREFLGTNVHKISPNLRVESGMLADPLGISAIVVSADGYLACGRRSRHVALHSGRLHTFGGMLELSDRRTDGTFDVFGAALRELREELNLRQAEAAGIVITGLVRDSSLRQPELLFDVTVSLTRSELVARFLQTSEPREHSGIEFVLDRPESILPFLEEAAPLVPVAEAALLLHGRLSWGNAWYEQSCLIRFGARLPAMPHHALPPQPG